MKLLLISRVFRKKWFWLLLFPITTAGTVVYLSRDMQREYVTNATIYTGLASGYSITSSEDSRVDYYAINNAFDNLITTIKSSETIEDVALHLLASHLQLTKPNPYILGPKGLAKLNELIDAKNRQLLVIAGNEAATYERLKLLAHRPENNLLKKILYDSKSNYAIEGITSRLTVARKNTSDMLELSFKADDPAVCQHTLRDLIDVFRERYTQMKSSETDNVVHYFEKQVHQSYKSLQGAENTLRDFGVDHKIINYGEQSKFVAESKEDMTTDYNREVMRFRAAKAAISTLEKRLSNRMTVVTTNDDILARRTELGKVQLQLANAMATGKPQSVIEPIQNTFTRLSEELRQVAHTYYNLNNSQEGLPQSNLLDDWLNKLIEYEESGARITVMQKRLREYDAIYTEFAPLGSTLNRMEREVGVAEKEYLSVLHGLNQARLRQKNLQMSGPLSVLDPPKFPLSPEPSKRAVLVIAAFIAGFVVMFTFFLVRELLNGSIRTPEEAEKRVGLPLAAAFPLINKKTTSGTLLRLRHDMLEQLRSVLMIETTAARSGTARPVNNYHLIILFSTRPTDRPSWVGTFLADLLTQAGHSVAYLYPHDTVMTDARPDHEECWRPYYPGPHFSDTRHVGELVSAAGFSGSSLSYVFLELPALREMAIPAALVAQASLSLLILDAASQWARLDSELVNFYRRASHNNVMMVVDQVEPDLLEPLTGPIGSKNRKRQPKPEPTHPTQTPAA
ncbi:GumC family protein [Spirosoma rhododendri]|uniref:Lipopolysaccharide biosynthesis protein n=1 Tax=Spirosoma rhododendri TaxID=2728024 RepID=A0A7L5DFX5_9BACT|nr:hypothetical protein [Spirosoma rhododendri]QJD77019.1 hypothetical protein HH216_00250 [Spirosoma rhododendri]